MQPDILPGIYRSDGPGGRLIQLFSEKNNAW
jgi:hypothetical protein